MLLSSVSESTCFFLGALSPMPAVKAFALYSGMALLFDFFMQITCFVSLIALDAARQEDNRFDVACCIRASKKAGDSSSKATGEGQEGTLYKLFKYFYAPFLMKVGPQKQSHIDCPLYFIYRSSELIQSYIKKSSPGFPGFACGAPQAQCQVHACSCL